MSQCSELIRTYIMRIYIYYMYNYMYIYICICKKCMHIYMCVYVYIYMYVCVHLITHTHTQNDSSIKRTTITLALLVHPWNIISLAQVSINDRSTSLQNFQLLDGSEHTAGLLAWGVPSGNLTVCYWKWPQKQLIYPARKWWIFPQLCKRLPEGKHACRIFHSKSIFKNHYDG